MHPPLAELPTEGEWTILEGAHEGKPILVRLNTSLAPFKGHPELAHQVAIAVPFKDRRDDGFLMDEEYPAINAIEDHVLDLFEIPGKSVLAVVITTNGMREFVLYTSLPEGTQALHRALEARVDSGHEVQVLLQPDPEWQVYDSFHVTDDA